MNPVFAGVALALTASAVLAVSARDVRIALVAVAVVLVATPFLADPLPPLLTLAMRVVGGALAAWLLRVATFPTTEGDDGRREPAVTGSRTGWPTEALLAVAAWIVGLSLSLNLVAANPAGPGAYPIDPRGALGTSAMATAAGLAMILVAVGPALWARDGFRCAVGLIVVVQGTVLFRTGVAGVASDLEQLAGMALTIAAASIGAVVIRLGAGGAGVGIEGPAHGQAQPADSGGTGKSRRSRVTVVGPE